MGKLDYDEQERQRRDEKQRFAEMMQQQSARETTLAKVRAELERRAAGGDPEAKGVIADLDRAARG